MVGVGLIPCARVAWFGVLLAFGWIRRRPDMGNDPCRPQTMSDKLVAATVPGKPHERTMCPPQCAEARPHSLRESVAGGFSPYRCGPSRTTDGNTLRAGRRCRWRPSSLSVQSGEHEPIESFMDEPAYRLVEKLP
jgi:hypothetical protein